MFKSHELSVKMTPAEDFLEFNSPSRLDFQSLLLPLPWEFPESHPSGGCGFFLEQPIDSQSFLTKTHFWTIFEDFQSGYGPN